jgi:UDP-glucose 4-epimerase
MEQIPIRTSAFITFSLLLPLKADLYTMKQKQVVLVTGGAGYIGSHTLIELLKNPEIEVVSVDNHANSSPEVYDRIRQISGRSVTHYPVDLCNRSETEKVFAAHPDISGIIHFAAYKAVGESVENPLKYYANNVGSLINILLLAKQYQVHRIIFSSSCSVYGNIEKLPVTESTPMGNTESPYAYTKVIGEKMIQDYIHE